MEFNTPRIIELTESPNNSPANDFIHLNVGGKFFDISKKIAFMSPYIEKFITGSQTTKINEKDIYFLDVDFKYFGEIIEVLKNNTPEEILLTKKGQFLDELIKYEILDIKYKQNPKIKLTGKKAPDAGKIITIQCKNICFQTYLHNIKKSPVLTDMIKEYCIELKDISSANFRYILYFLRNDELISMSKDVLFLIEKYKIPFELCIKNDLNKIHNYRNHEPIYYDNDIATTYPIISQIKKMDTHKSVNFLYDAKKYCPMTEICRSITVNEIVDNIYVFELTRAHFMSPNNISEILVGLDLKTRDGAYNIIEKIEIIIGSKIKLSYPSQYLKIKSILTNDKYVVLAENDENNINYDGVEINRCYMRLQCNLPLKALEDYGCYVKIYVHDIKKIKEVFIIANCIYVEDICETSPMNMISTHNLENIHVIRKKISDVDNIFEINYENEIIKDLIITIQDDVEFNNYGDICQDVLLDLSISYKIANEIKPYCHLDHIMLNKFFPLKHFAKCAEKGIYYYSFATEPLTNNLAGTIDAKNIILDIRTKKIKGIISVYVNCINQLNI